MTKNSLNQQTLPNIKVANHRHLGKSFERDLERTHAYYEMRKLAKIDRHPHVWDYISEFEYQQMLRRGLTELIAVCGNGRKMARKAANVDFSGCARNSPKSIFSTHVKFDAKMSQGERIPLGNFSKHQVDNLCISAECGAIAGFMIYFYEKARIFFCPASLVREFLNKKTGKQRAARGEGSLSISLLEERCVEIYFRNNLVDWLSALID